MLEQKRYQPLPYTFHRRARGCLSTVSNATATPDPKLDAEGSSLIDTAAAAAASGLCWNGRAGTAIAIECVLGAMADLMDRRNSLKATAMKRTGNSIDEATGAGAV
eukprot:scaffold55760_cov28-Cyclotella_meneghiniana.AAC.1